LYGAAFARQWDGTNLSDVKIVWAEKLGGFTAPHIGAALNACDERLYPPNLPEFIDLCRRNAKASSQIFPSLPPPQLTAEELVVRMRILAVLNEKLTGGAS
jgi:hypothetical protein